MFENRLLTPQLFEAVKPFPLYSQDGKGKDAICVAVFTIGRARWYVTEGSMEGDDLTMFGIVIGLIDDEYGYFTAGQLSEVEIAIKGCPDFPKLTIQPLDGWVAKPLSQITDKELQSFLSRIHDHDDEQVYEMTEEPEGDTEV